MTRSLLPYSLISLLLMSTSSLSRPISSNAEFRPLIERTNDFIANLARKSTTWDEAAIAPLELISYWPQITSPLAGEVFEQGSPLTLEWNNTFPPYPANQIPATAMLLLGYLSDLSEGFHLDLQNPLATAIPLYGGPNNHTVTLPTNLTTRSTYIVVLGSTGNTSPQFTINGSGPPDAASSPTATYSGPTIEALPTTYVVGGETTVIGGSPPPFTPPSSASPTAIASPPSGASPTPADAPASSQASTSASSSTSPTATTVGAGQAKSAPTSPSTSGSEKLSNLCRTSVTVISALATLYIIT